MWGIDWLKKKFSRSSQKVKEIIVPEYQAPTPGETALINWGVEFYKQKDGTLLVPGNLNVSNRGMTELPDLSNVVVDGNFSCMHNPLTSLKGAPKGFKSLVSDFGVFWEGHVPENLRNPPSAHGPKPSNGDFSL